MSGTSSEHKVSSMIQRYDHLDDGNDVGPIPHVLSVSQRLIKLGHCDVRGLDADVGLEAAFRRMDDVKEKQLI